MCITPCKPNPGYANGTVDGNGGETRAVFRNVRTAVTSHVVEHDAGSSPARPANRANDLQRRTNTHKYTLKSAKKCRKVRKNAFFVLTLHLNH